MDGKIK